MFASALPLEHEDEEVCRFDDWERLSIGHIVDVRAMSGQKIWSRMGSGEVSILKGSPLVQLFHSHFS